VKIAIIYDSKSGTTEKMAQAVAEGVREAGAEPVLKRATEATPADLEAADGIILGSPGQFGLPSFPLKEFLDQTGRLWMEGKLVGKAGGVFVTNYTLHGGKEQTMLGLITFMLHHGMVVVGLPASAPGNAVRGSYYGASASQATGGPTEEDLAAARALGRRVAEVAGALARATPAA